MKIFSLATIFATLAAPGLSQTVETGDIKQGFPVITRLDAKTLEDGEHNFWFRGQQNSFGGFLEIPVMVKKNGTGPVIFVQSSIHGDELAGTQVIFELFKSISLEQMTGTLVGIVGANPTGIPLHTRYFYTIGSGGSQTDLNRVMPGSNSSSNPTNQWAYSLWNDLYMPSEPTFFYDMHTTATGAAFPYFIYADRRVPEVDAYMSVTPADIIKNDTGIDGCVETEMIKAGVPAVTLELGSFKVWNKEINMRGVQGIKNSMFLMGMLEGEVDMMGVNTFECDTFASARSSTNGGYVEYVVELQDDVMEGDVCGVMYDGFGRVREEITAPTNGRVTLVGTDAIREPGATIARLCYMDKPVEEEAVVTAKKMLRTGQHFD